MRVLHLLKPWSEHVWRVVPRVASGDGCTDAAILACRGEMAGEPTAEHCACVMGSSDDERRVASLGLRTTDRIPMPLGVSRLAAPSLRRFLATRALFDEVRCWDASLVRMAQLAAPMSRVVDRVPQIADASPVAPADVASARLSRRNALGVGDDETVICLLADPPTRGDAVRLMFMAGTLYEARLRPHVILPRGSARLTRARDFHKAAALAGRLFITPEPAWAWLPACDAAVLVREESHITHAERVLIRGAHAMGVPVVGPRDDDVLSLYPPQAAGCLSDTNHAASLARSLVHVIESASRRDEMRVPLMRAAWRHTRELAHAGASA